MTNSSLDQKQRLTWNHLPLPPTYSALQPVHTTKPSVCSQTEGFCLRSSSAPALVTTSRAGRWPFRITSRRPCSSVRAGWSSRKRRHFTLQGRLQHLPGTLPDQGIRRAATIPDVWNLAPLRPRVTHRFAMIGSAFNRWTCHVVRRTVSHGGVSFPAPLEAAEKNFPQQDAPALSFLYLGTAFDNTSW